MWRWAAVAALVCVVGICDRAIANVVSVWGVNKADTGLVRAPLGIFVIGPSDDPYSCIAALTGQHKLKWHLCRQFNIGNFAVDCASAGGQYWKRGIGGGLPGKRFDSDVESWEPAKVFKTELRRIWRVSHETGGDPRPTIGFHHGGLAFHYVQLTAKDNVLRNSDADGRDRKERDSPGGSGGTSGRSIGGVFFLLFGAALLKISLDLTDGPNLSRREIAGSWIVGVLSGYLIIQGTVLLLVGGWLL